MWERRLEGEKGRVCMGKDREKSKMRKLGEGGKVEEEGR